MGTLSPRYEGRAPGPSSVAEGDAERGGQLQDVAIGAPEALAEDDSEIVEEAVAEGQVLRHQPVEVSPGDLQQLALGRGGDGRGPLPVAQEGHLAKELRRLQTDQRLPLGAVCLVDGDAQLLRYLDGADDEDKERVALFSLSENVVPGRNPMPPGCIRQAGELRVVQAVEQWHGAQGVDVAHEALGMPIAASSGSITYESDGFTWTRTAPSSKRRYSVPASENWFRMNWSMSE